jgi:hypothetical protein
VAEAKSIPDRVRRLLKQHVHSTEALQLLLCLSRQPAQLRSVAALAEECALLEVAAADALAQLAADGVAATNEERSHFGYPRMDTQTDEAVRELACVYAADRPAVLRLMNENAIERIRASMALAFADGFLLDAGPGEQPPDRRRTPSRRGRC